MTAHARSKGLRLDGNGSAPTPAGLDEVARAMDQLAAGHVSGKVVINPWR